MVKGQTKRGVFQAQDNLEKLFSLMKKELDKFYQEESLIEFDKNDLKITIKEIIQGYEKKILKARKEIEENKKLIRDLISEYETKILQQKETNIILKKRLDNDNSLAELEKLGFPRKFIQSSKKELAKEFIRLTKENFILDKTIKDLNKDLRLKKTEYATSKKTQEKKINILMAELFTSVNKNKDLSLRTESQEKKIAELENKISRMESIYEDRIKEIRKSNEKNTEELLRQNTLAKVTVMSEIEMLKKEIEGYKRKYLQTKEKEKEFAKNIERRLKEMIPAVFQQTDYDITVLDNVEKKDDLENLIMIKIANGDTSEKIMEDLKALGYDEKEIYLHLKKI